MSSTETRPPCRVKGCAGSGFKRGLCGRCYRYWLRTRQEPRCIPTVCERCGAALSSGLRRIGRRFCSNSCASMAWVARQPQEGPVCLVGGCTRPALFRGVCRACWRRSRYRSLRSEASYRSQCAHCGAGMRHLPKRHDRMFCSKSCCARSWELRNSEHNDAAKRQRRRSRIRLDSEVGLRHGGMSSRHQLVGFDDPAFAQIETQVDTEALVRSAPILPFNWRRRLADGEFDFIADEYGPRFVTPRRVATDAVPWQDFAGPIPSMPIYSAGKMARSGHRRTRQQQVTLMAGKRIAKKAKSAA